MITAAFILFFSLGPGHPPGIIELRKLYYKAYDNKRSADEFFSVMMEVKNSTTPLMMGYSGMAYMMKAKFLYNPYTKMSSFTTGKDLLNNAINKDPESIELRFMRFCAQTNAPRFLGYNRQIKEDKAIVLAKWRKCTDIDLKIKIKDVLLKSDYCNNYEKSIFE